MQTERGREARPGSTAVINTLWAQERDPGGGWPFKQSWPLPALGLLLLPPLEQDGSLAEGLSGEGLRRQRGPPMLPLQRWEMRDPSRRRIRSKNLSIHCGPAGRIGCCYLSVNESSSHTSSGVKSYCFICRGAEFGFPGGTVFKNLPVNAGNLGSIPRSGRSPGGVHGNPLQYFCLENPHGQRSLAGYSPWGHKESDATEHAHTLKYGAGCPTLQVREVREAVTLDENSLVPRFWKVPPP